MILSSSIIHSFYDQTKSSRESSENDEQLEIISAAAKLIRNDVYSMQIERVLSVLFQILHL